MGRQPYEQHLEVYKDLVDRSYDKLTKTAYVDLSIGIYDTTVWSPDLALMNTEAEKADGPLAAHFRDCNIYYPAIQEKLPRPIYQRNFSSSGNVAQHSGWGCVFSL